MFEISQQRMSLQIARPRNYSYRTEKTHAEHQRKKSLLLSEIKDTYEYKPKFILPHLKMEPQLPYFQELTKLSKHYKLMLRQINNPVEWVTHLNTMWENFCIQGDPHDDLQKIVIQQKIEQLQAKYDEIYLYDKIIIAAGYELQQQQEFIEFYNLQLDALTVLYQIIAHQNNDQKQQIIFYLGLDKRRLTQDNLLVLYVQKLKQLQIMYLTILPKKIKYICLLQIFKRCTQSYQQNLRIIRKSFAQYMSETRRQDIIQNIPANLQYPAMPFIIQKIDHPILVLDLDETLVHYNTEEQKLYLRPGIEDFLTILHSYYYIAIWTASFPKYAKWALKQIHPQIEKHVDFLLTREYCIPNERGGHTKRISFLGPPLNRILLIDNDYRNIHDREKDYALIVDSYRGKPDDNMLDNLKSRLIQAHQKYETGMPLGVALKNTY